MSAPRQQVAARRGDQLREHILFTAKDVFLELGFERTSMDVVALRAQTSKRSLYAHYASKERLFLAVIDFVRELFLSRLKTPKDYPGTPVRALTMFCGRYVEILLYEASIQMLRISMAEGARFPQQATQYFDAMFDEVRKRLAAYLRGTFALSSSIGNDAADRLLGRLLYPRLPRALFGIDPLAKTFDHEALSSSVDLKPIRKLVRDVVDSLGA